MSAAFFECRDHVIPAQHIRGYSRATANSEEQQLQISIKQYIPLDNSTPRPGDVTIIACHAAAFFKEMYEPLFDEIYHASMQPSSSFKIRGIWIADVASHGTSSTLNEGRLGHDYSWDDHARDLLGIVNHFRNQMPMPLVGLGHSMGSVNIIQLSLMHPRLFTTIVCIEPPIAKKVDPADLAPAYGILKRCDIWASKEDAVRETARGGLQGNWDPRVAACWAKHAFRELPTLLYPEAPVAIAREAQRQGSRPVTFSTTKHHAVRAFTRAAHPSPGTPLASFVHSHSRCPGISKDEHTASRLPVYRPEATVVFRQLRHLRPSCLWVYGSGSSFWSSSPQSRADKLEITGSAPDGSGGAEAKAVEEVVIKGGHFVPFENPKLVAEQFFQWTAARLRDCNSERDSEAQAWDKLSERDKAMVDDDMAWWMNETFSARSRKKAALVSIRGSPAVSSKL